ncbi:unnamed protein product, partial [Medioppia subpectinata]
MKTTMNLAPEVTGASLADNRQPSREQHPIIAEEDNNDSLPNGGPHMVANNNDKNILENNLSNNTDNKNNNTSDLYHKNDVFNSSDSIKNRKKYSADTDCPHSPEQCRNLSYDNPAYIGLSINHVNHHNRAGSLTAPPTNISIHISNTVLGPTVPPTPPPVAFIDSNGSVASIGCDSYGRPVPSRERTMSVSSVKSVRMMLTPDRRYSRRQSMLQRKIDAHERSHDRSSGGGGPGSSGADDPDNESNPLRRRMSFIKDTSGEEPLNRALIQILIASLFAGFGNVGAGVVINIIQGWRVFIDIHSMFVLIPSLLGLKGNLEMTMASRLSTEANLGHMNKWGKTLRMIGGDMSLVQCQATVVSFMAAFVAILIDFIQTKNFNLNNSLVLISSAVVTANIACFLLGLVMAFVIIFSNRVNIDPDNIATPIAASLGDVSTAAIFAYTSQIIYSEIQDWTGDQKSGVPIMAVTGIVVFLVLLPVFYTIARVNNFTRNLVHTGWFPVLCAMCISSGGGFFLDSAVDRYDKLPPFQPVICGVGGNLVAVAASKISTRLHMNQKLGVLPFGVSRVSSPIGVFFNRRVPDKMLAMVVVAMNVVLVVVSGSAALGSPMLCNNPKHTNRKAEPKRSPSDVNNGMADISGLILNDHNK